MPKSGTWNENTRSSYARELQNLTGYDFTQAAPDLESEQARLEAATQPRVLKCLHEFIAAGGLSDSLTAEDPS